MKFISTKHEHAMNPTNKKSPRGVPQPFNRPAGHATQTRPVVVQLKSGVSAHGIKQPVAPPVYRPQPTPKVMQRKLANVAATADPVALDLRRSQPSPKLQTSAVSPFRGVVQRALVARRGGGGGGGKRPPGGRKPPAPDHYAEDSRIIATYGMDEAYQRWLIIGKKLGIKAPDLSGFHASKPGKAGGKAEKKRAEAIAAIFEEWKVGLFLYLAAVRGIQEEKLGRIETALAKK
jgi:hypothetical protein